MKSDRASDLHLVREKSARPQGEKAPAPTKLSPMAEAVVSVGGERAIVRMFVASQSTAQGQDPRLPFASADDTVRTEMAFPYGRADVVLFHMDGSATVVEVKDGQKGYTHVIAGIGQAGLYATQLALKATVRTVRRALLWTSVGDATADAMIEMASEAAGVIPLAWGSLPAYLKALR